MSAPANYDLNEIFDALAAVLNGMASGDEIGGYAVQVVAEPEVAGDVQTPAIFLELDDLDYDSTMGAGSDTFQIVATVLVSLADSRIGQRSLRSFLSRKSDGLTVVRIKEALEAGDPTMGGLVSYVHLSGMRRFGRITYDGTDYLGAELILQGVS